MTFCKRLARPDFSDGLHADAFILELVDWHRVFVSEVFHTDAVGFACAPGRECGKTCDRESNGANPQRNIGRSRRSNRNEQNRNEGAEHNANIVGDRIAGNPEPSRKEFRPEARYDCVIPLVGLCQLAESEAA
ncbi:MAG: hypothetical protein QOF74_5699 [Caballeronia mineralivorans]|nr:hypothetical protein [Caballeronia mineralivorans]